jgi:hypothetical protein
MSDDNQQGGSIGQTREKIEKQIDKLIDNYATKIPVASQYKDVWVGCSRETKIRS